MGKIVRVKLHVFAIGFFLSLSGSSASAQLVTHYTFDGNALEHFGLMRTPLRITPSCLATVVAHAAPRSLLG
ncbi:MAG: hypothetical protein HZC43_10475 [Nitrosomonadales bacterium]|nr:hypothetical protein [Nitrosomonadales bacterium]